MSLNVPEREESERRSDSSLDDSFDERCEDADCAVCWDLWWQEIDSRTVNNVLKHGKKPLRLACLSGKSVSKKRTTHLFLVSITDHNVYIHVYNSVLKKNPGNFSLKLMRLQADPSLFSVLCKHSSRVR